MDEQTDISTVYFQILQQNKPEPGHLDYSLVEKHLQSLDTLSKIGNSGISVFDLYQQKHIFYSPNFGELLGYRMGDKAQELLDDQIHPDDKVQLFQIGISALKLFFNLSPDEKTHYKLINEYRILNANSIYIRLIEQHQVLETDCKGNAWLTISIIDLSPNQDEYSGVKSRILNFRTGQIIPMSIHSNSIQVELTKREKEILSLVKEGLLSKEISDKLSISVHTVNTHRQKLLEKLGANNSMEAVIFSSRLGLLD